MRLLGELFKATPFGGGNLLKQIVRCKNEEGSENKLQTELLEAASKQLGEKGVFIHDAGTTVKAVQAAGIERYIIRLPKNCVARWNKLPENAHGNRLKGDLIRPLARKRKEQEIESTNDPSETTTFVYQGRTIKAWHWQNVVTSDVAVSDDAATYDIWFFLTLYIRSHYLLPQILLQARQRFFNCILTVGVLNNCH